MIPWPGLIMLKKILPQRDRLYVRKGHGWLQHVFIASNVQKNT